ncbi:MAG: hypothetical protein GX028_08795 [Clostridiaceae bacterium]|nr:hypothetical protein [Clostridiaceae bacterium]
MNKHQQKVVIMFLLPIFVLSAFKLVWPDQAISAQENRSLQQRPVFSWSNFIDGSFGRDTEKWFADQFPFRNTLIQVNNSVKELMSFSFDDDQVTLIQGPANDLGSGQILTDDDPAETLAPEPSVSNAGGQNDPSETSNDQVDNEPDTTESSVVPAETSELDKTETTVAPAPVEPLPTPGVEGEVADYSAVIIVNNVAMEIYGFSQSKSDYYAELINRLAAKVDSAQVYNLLAPTAIEFYSPEKYHSLSSSQAVAIDNTYSRLSPEIRSVDAYSELAAHWQDYIYFRSDHHWTALGAYYGYRAFAAAAGIEPVPLEALTHGRIEGDFLGSLYRYTQSSVLAATPDIVNYYEPAVTAIGTAYQDVSMQNGRSIELINKTTKTKSQYLAFIEGDHPLAHYNTSTKNGRSVIVIKESYGNAFVPYLASHYENVYVADPRSINMDLPAFVQDNNINDIVVINYTFAISNSKWVEGFNKMIG